MGCFWCIVSRFINKKVIIALVTAEAAHTKSVHQNILSLGICKRLAKLDNLVGATYTAKTKSKKTMSIPPLPLRSSVISNKKRPFSSPPQKAFKHNDRVIKDNRKSYMLSPQTANRKSRAMLSPAEVRKQSSHDIPHLTSRSMMNPSSTGRTMTGYWKPSSNRLQTSFPLTKHSEENSFKKLLWITHEQNAANIEGFQERELSIETFYDIRPYNKVMHHINIFGVFLLRCDGWDLLCFGCPPLFTSQKKKKKNKNKNKRENQDIH